MTALVFLDTVGLIAGIVDQVPLVVMRRPGTLRAFTDDRRYPARGIEMLF